MIFRVNMWSIYSTGLVLCTFKENSVAFCSQPEVTCDVIPERFVRQIVLDKVKQLVILGCTVVEIFDSKSSEVALSSSFALLSDRKWLNSYLSRA